MSEMGKIIIGVGAVIILIGAVIWGAGRLGYQGLPGDIRYESRNVRFYFPIVTCLILSALLTAGMWVWQWFHRR